MLAVGGVLVQGAAVVTAPAIAWAQHDAPGSIPDTLMRATREAFRAGMEAGERGRWDEARASFERAYGMQPRPLILLNLALAQAHTGRLVEAAENYRRFLQEATEGRPAEFRDQATRALADLEPRIPRATLAAQGMVSGDALTLDAQQLPAAAIGTELPLDAGHHVLAITRDGREVAHATFDLGESERRDVAIIAPPPTRAVAVTPAHPVVAIVPAHSRDGTRPPSVFASPWFWTVAGVLAAGAAGAVATVVLVHPPNNPTDLDPPVLRVR
jgi:hypothetical protein